MRQVAVESSGRWPGFETGEGSALLAETLADHQGARSIRKVGVGRLAAAVAPSEGSIDQPVTAAAARRMWLSREQSLRQEYTCRGGV